MVEMTDGIFSTINCLHPNDNEKLPNSKSEQQAKKSSKELLTVSIKPHMLKTK